MYMMFIEGQLKPGTKDQFLSAWNSQILPMLKKQDGFIQEVLLFEDEQKPCGLSFWKTREQCEHYRQNVFPQVKSYVQPLLNGTPTTRGFDVASAEVFNLTLKAA